ncbi:MAG: CDP-alcohol phosphatidyltransferase family protein [Betaproteobacteria bacterium]|nr:CDP-alcohol phosphatidyltransferase family protein [Betaproteobacteria bacterium]
MRYIPNLITLARLCIAPLEVGVLLQGRYVAATALFLAAGVSDALDGFLARRFRWFTRLGAVLDPVADKVVLLATLVTTTWLGLVPDWVASSLIGRDALIIGGAAAYRWLFGELDIAPSRLGKIHVFLEFALLGLVMAQAAGFVGGGRWMHALFDVVFASAALSGCHYVWTWSHKARRAAAAGAS